jgi:tRNA-dihydrouridine synthase C
MPVFWASVCARVQPRHRAGRLKQWLHYLRRAYPEAQQAFAEWREETDPARLQAWVLQGLPST